MTIAERARRRKPPQPPAPALRRLDAPARNEIRRQLRDCAEAVGGEVSARERASRLGRTYAALDADGRHDFLRLLALEFGPDPRAVGHAHAIYQSMLGSHLQWDAEAALRAALRSPRMRILTQFNALPEGVKFLVDLRADLLAFAGGDPCLAALDREMEARLTGWFDVGFLELRRITWNSPAALLEKLIHYEAVHEIRSWNDLRHRLDPDRRCYAFFHPRMPDEPLIFVEVALTRRMADRVQALIDENRAVGDAALADTAIFYSISNTQKGLRGVHFGNFLLKRVIDALRADLPRLRTFATLSPLPGFRQWMRDQAYGTDRLLPARLRERLLALPEQPAPQDLRPFRSALDRLCAHYLLCARHDGQPLDAVARFHLGNGARVERINACADTSARGMARAFGWMVNYLYDLERLDDNVEAFARGAPVPAAARVARLLARAK